MNLDTNKIKQSLLLVLAFSCFLNVSAQRGDIYNQGVLYIGPSTKFTSEAHFINKQTGKYINDGEALILKNFHNEGIVSFSSQSNGYTRFEGLEIQEISGGAKSDFKDVLFDNTSQDYSFILSGEMNIAGQADFYRGILDNYNYNGRIHFDEEATVIAANDKSYIEGVASRSGSLSLLPIGKDKMYRPAGAVSLGSTPMQFAAEYHAYNSDAQYPHSQHAITVNEIDDKEFWIIEGVNEHKEAMINLTFDSRTTPVRLLNDYEALEVMAWDSNTRQWVNLGGAIDTDTNMVTSVVEMSPGYSVFTLGSSREAPNEDNIKIYNAVNPGDIGGNEYLRIEGLEDFPENRVRVYNRWGVTVFDESNYDTNDNVFRGISDGRANIERGKELPVGTYFYTLKYVVPGSNGATKNIQGYLYLNR